MLTWNRLGWAMAFELASTVAWAQGHHHHHGGGGGGLLAVPGVVGGLGAGYGFPYYSSIGANGLPFSFAPAQPLLVPLVLMPGSGLLPNTSPALAAAEGVAGPWPEFLQDQPRKPAPAEAVRQGRADSARATQYMTFGDCVFRSGNLHRAAERYEQAMAADPRAAAPRVRLAQVALVRGQYSEAANRFREALSIEPDWLVNALDIQSLYSEPAEYARHIAKLESHLHAQPGDRDAWFVLGAQWYLSGQTRKAADVFLRLTDRKGDPTLAAFLQASTPREPDPK